MTSLTQEFDIRPSHRGVYNHSNVATWSSRVVPPGKTLFDLAKLFIPINVDRSHWVGIMVSFQEQTIHFYDSGKKPMPGTHYLDIVRRYLSDEHRLHLRAPLPPTWRVIENQPSTPRQPNGYDCGVYCCHFADRLLSGHSLAVPYSSIARYRGWMAYCLMAGQLPAL